MVFDAGLILDQRSEIYLPVLVIISLNKFCNSQ